MKPQQKHNNWISRPSTGQRIKKCHHTQPEQQHTQTVKQSLERTAQKHNIVTEIAPKIPKNQHAQRNETQPCFNIDNEHDQQCECMQCDYWKHIYQLALPVQHHQIRMESAYQKAFVPPGQTFPNKPTFDGSRNASKMTANRICLTSKSIYSTSFESGVNSKGNCIIKPVDQIKEAGDAPTQKSTTYTSSFIGHRGQNQYIKSLPSQVSSVLPFRAQSSYQREFVKKSIPRHQSLIGKASNEQTRIINEQINKSTLVSSYQRNYSNLLDIDNQQDTKHIKDNIPEQDSKKLKRLNFGHSFFRPKNSLNSTYGDSAMINTANVTIAAQKPVQSTYSREFQIREGKLYCPARIKRRNFHKNLINSLEKQPRNIRNFQ